MNATTTEKGTAMSMEKAREHLRVLGLEERVLETDELTATVDLAAAAFGVEPGSIAKSMAFLLDAETAILVLAEGTARIDNRKFKDTFHKRSRMISRDDVEHYIGHAPGGVCPFGVNADVAVYLDESLRRWDVVYPACGNDHSAVRLTLDELERASGAIGWVDICKEPQP